MQNFSEHKRVLLIINPIAGRMNFKNSFYSVMKSFSDAGFLTEAYFTKGKDDAARCAFDAAERYDLIVACGGDGTLNETVSGVLRSGRDVPIGYLPCGSTNDFASSLGIPQKTQETVKQIIEGRMLTMDIGHFNDRYFTYTASFGAFTSTSYDTSQALKNTIGHLAYILSGTKQLANLKAIPMKITTPDYSEEGSFIYGGVSNTTSIGGVYSLPDDEVILNDGKFEVLLIRKPANPAGYINTLLNFAARNYDDPNILFMHAENVIFESPADVTYTLDGEFGGAHKRAEISCLHNAYRINGKQE